MKKTGQQIENDVYALLRAGDLAAMIGGEVYKMGLRPLDSQREDAVVRFVEGTAGQIQTGTVAVDIYVPDMVPYDDGVARKDTARCAKLEQAADQWVGGLTAGRSEYLFEQGKTLCAETEKEIKQHCITVQLKYKLSTI